MSKMIILFVMFSFFVMSPASAGNILFVSDDNSDNNIPAALSVDGHTVTSSSDRSVLLGDLSSYCAVYWSASDDGEFDLSSIISNLTSYVSSGGFVFVTGGDSVASPVNSDMLSFVGGTNGWDGGDVSGVIINTSNSLTTGVIDIRNITPPDVIGDGDTLCIPLSAGTVGIVASNENDCTGYAWTLRTLGSGQIAWISSGNFNNDADEPDWTDTTIPGEGVYNAALRNFAYNACPTTTAVPSMTEWGMIIFMVLAGLGAVYFIRRQKTAKN